jgi:hypothetical protein
VTTFHWIDDIYKEYRNWRRTVEAARTWDPLMRAAGNDPKGGGKYTPRFVTLLDGTRVVPYDENILIEVTGEAITDNADVDPDPFDTSTRTQPLKLYITPPAAELVRAEAEIAAVNRMSFDGGVTIDVINGVSGTDGLKGNKEFPVNNLADAMIIAQSHSFKTLYILGNLTLGATDSVAGYTVVGEDPSSTLLTMTAGNTTTAAKMKHLTITGTCGGRMDMTDCHLVDIVGLCASGGDANIIDCMLMGSVQFKDIADRTFNFISCYGPSGTDAVTVDCNGCMADVNFIDWTGKITVQNINHADCNWSFNVDAGHLILEASIALAAKVVVGGVAKFDNYSSLPQDILDTSGLQIPVIDQYHETIYFDAVAGHAGSDYPQGLRDADNPVDNLPDMLLLAQKFVANKLHFHSDATIASGIDVSHFIIEAHSTFKHLLTFEAGCIMENSIVRNLKITGVLGGWCSFENVLMINTSEIWGHIENALWDGNISYRNDPTTHVHVNGVRSHTTSMVNVSVGQAEGNIVNAFGMFTIKDKSGSNQFNMHCGYGAVTVDASCVSGNIYFAGEGFVTHAAGSGCTVICNGRVVPNDGVTYAMEITDANIVSVIGDPVMAGSSKNTEWGGTP